MAKSIAEAVKDGYSICYTQQRALDVLESLEKLLRDKRLRKDYGPKTECVNNLTACLDRLRKFKDEYQGIIDMPSKVYSGLREIASLNIKSLDPKIYHELFPEDK